jgi:transposase
MGIEAAGHYHQALAATLQGKGFDVVELNPYQGKIAPAQFGQATIKVDLREYIAMVEVLVRGQGRPLHRRTVPSLNKPCWSPGLSSTSPTVITANSSC